MMAISTNTIQRLNSALGILGRPRRILDNGEWIDTGCMEWSRLPSVPDIWSRMSPGLKDAYQRSQEFLQREYANGTVATMEEFFSHEPASIQAEFAEFIAQLQKAYSPYGETPPMPEYSQDLQDAFTRIGERLEGEDFMNGDEFDIDRYMARRRELFKEEPPHIQAELDALTPRIQELSRLPRRMARQRKRTMKQIQTLLQGEPAIAFRAGIECDGMPSSTYDTIVIAPTTDQFDILRYERTNGANRGLQTEDVIAKLKMLDEKYGIEIVGAGMDGVEFILKRIPKGKEARELGKWLFDFCPDLYQAPESFPKGKVSLWWD